MKNLIWILLILINSSLYAETIDEYNVTIEVNKSGSLHIKEQINYYFGIVERHGILRDIPIDVKLSSLSPPMPIGLDNFKISMDNHNVPYKIEYINIGNSNKRYIRLKIGDPNKTVKSNHIYTIEYDVAHTIFPSEFDDMEALRWNAIGSLTKVTTKYANIKVYLPKNINKDNTKVRAWRGYVGSKESVEYRWIDNSIEFKTKFLQPYQALTIEINIPKYILSQGSSALQANLFDYLKYYWYIAASLVYIIFMWIYSATVYGTNTPNIKSVTRVTTPPKELSILQAGLILDKIADKKDLIPAIIELADKGYLKISLSNKEPQIIKTDKPIDESRLSSDQLYILNNILFRFDDIYRVKKDDYFRSKELKRQLEQLKKILYRWSKDSGVIKENILNSRYNFLRDSIIAGGTLSIFAMYDFVQRYDLSLLLALLMFGTFFIIGIVFVRNYYKKRRYVGLITSGIWTFISFSILFGLITDKDGLTLLYSPLILPVVVLFTTKILYKKVGIYTKKGLKIYKELMGYKKYLEDIKETKSKLSSFLHKQPNLLNQSLPYAILFGLKEHWLYLYSETSNQPAWFDGSFEDDFEDFEYSLDMEMTLSFDSPQSDYGSSSYYSSTSSSSSSGSFSGGGGGGGGVSSW